MRKAPRRKVKSKPLADIEQVEVSGTKPGGPRRFTRSKEQVRAELAFVQVRIASMASFNSIIADLRAQYGCGANRARMLIARVRAQWAAEDADRRATWKSDQIRSIERSVHQLEMQIADALRLQSEARQESPPRRIAGPAHHLYTNKARYLELLAEITGTMAPMEVHHTGNVQLSAAVVAVVASLSGEEAAELLQEAEENERLAKAYVDEHAADSVKGELQ